MLIKPPSYTQYSDERGDLFVFEKKGFRLDNLGLVRELSSINNGDFVIILEGKIHINNKIVLDRLDCFLNNDKSNLKIQGSFAGLKFSIVPDTIDSSPCKFNGFSTPFSFDVSKFKEISNSQCKNFFGRDFRRIYILANNSKDAVRGKHLHRNLNQFLFSYGDSFDISLSCKEQETETSYSLSPFNGVMIGNETWRELFNFKKKTLAIVLATEYFNPKDYEYNK